MHVTYVCNVVCECVYACKQVGRYVRRARLQAGCDVKFNGLSTGALALALWFRSISYRRERERERERERAERMLPQSSAYSA